MGAEAGAWCLQGSEAVVSKQREDHGEGMGKPRAVPQGVVNLSVDYPVRDEFEAAFARELFGGAVFVPTLDRLSSGQRVRVSFDLLFCETRFALDGEVVASLPAPIASAGGAPGVSVQFLEPPAGLREKIERATDIQFGDVPPRRAEFPLAEPRFPAQASVLLEIDGRRLSAEMGDVSYNGMLALLPDVDLGDVTDLRVAIEHPGSGERIELDCHIANQARCDDGLMVIGLKFDYELDRIDDVSRFIDDLRSYHHARALATVSGSIADTPLESVLETFASVSDSGTLLLTRGDERGKIAYQNGEIFYVAIGLLSGSKALDRLFTWDDAQFEFRPEVEPVDGIPGSLPLTPAILAAVVARDELAQLDLAGFDPNMTFSIDAERLEVIDSTLDEIGRGIAEHARMGFPVSAMLDMLAASDARIYKTLIELIEAGALSIERE
jgi:Tfp pilus assembly protein PilZ